MADDEREQVEQVFGLTGGELEDTPWEPSYAVELPRWDEATESVVNFGSRLPFRFTYWYMDGPSYTDHELLTHDGETYRTVVRDEMFGQVPERVYDDEGTWKVVKRYRNSGETQCPYFGRKYEQKAGPGATECPLCNALVGEEHGYVYIGDGWSEIVYQLVDLALPRPGTTLVTLTVETTVIASRFTSKDARRAVVLAVYREKPHYLVTEIREQFYTWSDEGTDSYEHLTNAMGAYDLATYVPDDDDPGVDES